MITEGQKLELSGLVSRIKQLRAMKESVDKEEKALAECTQRFLTDALGFDRNQTFSLIEAIERACERSNP